MTGAAALREVERRIIPVRTVAGEVESRSRWVREAIPDGLPPREAALLGQGFSAGYDAAMRRVTELLAEVQTMALREDQ